MSDSEPICMACGMLARRHGLCGRCRPGYRRAWVVGQYHSPLGDMIKAMKSIGTRSAIVIAGELMASHLPTLPPEVRIVPIPTIAPHRRERGFDHTYLMARVIATRMGCTVDLCLKRQSNTVQRGQNKRQRLQQAKQAYRVEGVCDPDAIYLLVDDVVTTGASMSAAATCLRAAGARTVWAVALTREALKARSD